MRWGLLFFSPLGLLMPSAPSGEARNAPESAQEIEKKIDDLLNHCLTVPANSKKDGPKIQIHKKIPRVTFWFTYCFACALVYGGLQEIVNLFVWAGIYTPLGMKNSLMPTVLLGVMLLFLWRMEAQGLKAHAPTFIVYYATDSFWKKMKRTFLKIKEEFVKSFLDLMGVLPATIFYALLGLPWLMMLSAVCHWFYARYQYHRLNLSLYGQKPIKIESKEPTQLSYIFTREPGMDQEKILEKYPGLNKKNKCTILFKPFDKSNHARIMHDYYDNQKDKYVLCKGNICLSCMNAHVKEKKKNHIKRECPFCKNQEIMEVIEPFLNVKCSTSLYKVQEIKEKRAETLKGGKIWARLPVMRYSVRFGSALADWFLGRSL